MDPQRFSNTLFISILHSLKTNAKGGLVVETDAVDNKGTFEDSWSKSDAISWVRPGANSGGKIMPKTPPALPAQLSQLMEFCVGAIPDIAGVNADLLGQSEQVKPGVVEAMRTKAGLIILAPWFDALRLYMKKDGRVLAEMIVKFISDGRKARIMGPTGAQYIQIFARPEWLEMDVIVDESSHSRDVKDRTFVALMQLVPMAMQAGLPVPPDVLDYAPIPQSLTQKWKEQIQQQAQKPKEPSEKEKIEQIKAQNAQAIEAQKHKSNMEQTQIEAAQQRDTEQAQAESQRAIESHKAQTKQLEMMMNAALKKKEFEFEAKMEAMRFALEAKMAEMEFQHSMALENRKADVAETQARHSAVLNEQKAHHQAEAMKQKAKAKPRPK
jgi:hypothetical protein